MKKNLTLAGCALASLWVLMHVPSHAAELGGVQTTPPAVSEKSVVAPLAPPSKVVIGEGTNKLLAMQRAAVAAKPRFIDGDQAIRSYERYLKSFEHPIPEAFETGTNAGQ